MKIKEVDRTANVAWSPSECYPIYLAAGTAAQQLDSSFSTNSQLEIYEFDVNQAGLDMPLKASISCQQRFHKLIWGGHGLGEEHKLGVIVGGSESGIMEVYDPNKIMNNEGKEQSLILSKNKHTGPVRALDFNPFRPALLASGASDSEIFIWDLTNPKTPMTPGAQSQPADDVTCLAWNKQVEHILASTFSTRCVVWDLRKNEPIIKLADPSAKIRYKVVAWHPTVATQMCLGSEDDTNPVIQLWDLRYATSPLKVLQAHERGVLGLAWSQKDPELLLSCGKDNRIHCWNPNYSYPGYELVCDIPTSCQWSFDVSLCPRNPIVFSTASFDGRVSVYGLSGGRQEAVTNSKLADSFSGMDMDMSHAPVPVSKPAIVHLRDAPKWLKRPAGASFAFGGKLVEFSNTLKQSSGSGAGDVSEHYEGKVEISQVTTLPEFLTRSQRLKDALDSGYLAEFCLEKSSEASDESESKVWRFLQASFSDNPSDTYLSILGFDLHDINNKLEDVMMRTKSESVDTITDGFVSLGRSENKNEGFGSLNNIGTQNLLYPVDNSSVFDTLSTDSTRSVTPEPEKLFQIITDDSREGLLNLALLSGNLEHAVDLCLKDSRWADALILASTGGPELIKKAQIRYFHKCQNETSIMVRAVVTQDLRRLVERCDLECWKQALGTVLTYAQPNDFSVLAETIGRRLEGSKNEALRKDALLCYICSGNINRLAENWSKDLTTTQSPIELQSLVEKVMILKKASEMHGNSSVISPVLSEKLSEYASLLVSQGYLEAAVPYLDEPTTDPFTLELKERVFMALGHKATPRQTRQSMSQEPTMGRSRQTSESSNTSKHTPLTKRPSYPLTTQLSPSANLYDGGRASFSSVSGGGGADLSCLTGPPEPPHVYNPLNVTTSFGGGGGGGGGFSNTTGNMAFLPQMESLHEKNQVRRYSGSTTGSQSAFSPSLPQPPTSSAAHGWNDPPPIKAKPKTSQASTPQAAITHPIFGTGADPNQGTSHPPGMFNPMNPTMPTPYDSGTNLLSHAPPPMGPPKQYGQHQPPPSSYSQQNPSALPPRSTFTPTPQLSSYGSPPPPTSTTFQPPSYNPIQNNTQNYNMPPPPSPLNANSNPYSNPPPVGPPPTSGFKSGSFSAPKSGIGAHAPPPISSYGTSNIMTPPPPTNNNASYGLTNSTSFGPPPSSSNTPNYGSPTTKSSFGPPPTNSNNFGPPPPSSTSFGAPPTNNTNFGPHPPSSTSFGPPPTSSNFGAPPTNNTNFGPPPPSSTSFGPPPSSSNFGAPPTNNTNFGPPPPSSTSFGPPPTSSNFGAPPTNNTNFGPPPPSSTSFGAPPTSSNFGPPPPSKFSAPPTSSSNFGASSTNNTNFGPPPPSSTSFGAPLTNSNFGPPPSSNNFSAPPPSSNFGAPPPSTNFKPPPTSSASYGAPPTGASNFGAPPTNASNFGVAPPSSSNYPSAPPTSNSNPFPSVGSNYGAPPPLNSGFGGTY